MKKNYLLISAFAAMLAFASCEGNDEKAENKILVPPSGTIEGLYADCLPGTNNGFIANLTTHINQSITFFVKGKVKGEPIETSGRQIQIIEDLKGNFPDNETTIIIWGNGGGGETSYNELGSSLFSYSDGEELLILFKEGYWDDETGEPHQFYYTATCGNSVLKISGENVTGGIYDPYANETIPYQELLPYFENHFRESIVGRWKLETTVTIISHIEYNFNVDTVYYTSNNIIYDFLPDNVLVVSGTEQIENNLPEGEYSYEYTRPTILGTGEPWGQLPFSGLTIDSHSSNGAFALIEDDTMEIRRYFIAGQEDYGFEFLYKGEPLITGTGVATYQTFIKIE